MGGPSFSDTSQNLQSDHKGHARWRKPGANLRYHTPRNGCDSYGPINRGEITPVKPISLPPSKGTVSYNPIMWQQNNIYSWKTNECPLQKQWLVQMYFLLKYIPLTNSLDYSFRGCKRIFSTSRKVWNSWVNQKTQIFAHAFWNPSCFPWWWINTAFKISRDNSLTNLTIRNSYVGTLGNSKTWVLLDFIGPDKPKKLKMCGVCMPMFE